MFKDRPSPPSKSIARHSQNQEYESKRVGGLGLHRFGIPAQFNSRIKKMGEDFHPLPVIKEVGEKTLFDPDFNLLIVVVDFNQGQGPGLFQLVQDRQNVNIHVVVAAPEVVVVVFICRQLEEALDETERKGEPEIFFF